MQLDITVDDGGSEGGGTQGWKELVEVQLNVVVDGGGSEGGGMQGWEEEAAEVKGDGRGSMKLGGRG